ncbi:MAG: outer membrane lipid asymmetry maintenance protein MlaD [Rhodobiaceae bacterium]|nr:outer membrane lipid asymmetry maintenance protein MlaD [Rhodobiaceae bacterium]RPF97940.1 MAG: outer membrane lipid asymmetry maintenance protein MlaD [Rhizobiales bacterium TMED227]|tara:strand:+ start:818 stop:1258 length:441 start_codon:yes stop_codon:yes gene_type:complete
MRNNLLESLIGFVVIIIAIIFFIYSYSMMGNKNSSRTYEITAVFNEVSGLMSGSDVRLSGIKVGSVTTQTLDGDSYEAVVSMQINNDIKIPTDSSAKISAEGLLGGNYISIEPGGSDEILMDGDVIEFTQGSIDLIGLLGNAVFGS